LGVAAVLIVKSAAERGINGGARRALDGRRQAGVAVLAVGCPVTTEREGLLGSWYRAFITAIEGGFVRLANRRNWRLVGTLAALALSLSITFPHISYFTGRDRAIQSFWPVIERQAAHPFAVDDVVHTDPTNHAAKMAFRLTLPLAARVLRLGEPGLIALQMLLGVWLLYLIAGIADSLFKDRVAALALMFAVGSTFIGKAAFLELGGIGDGVAFAFLAAAAYFRAPPIVFVSVLIACFTDERGALSAPLVALYWTIRETWRSPRAWAVVAGLMSYCALRLWMIRAFGMHTPMGSDSRCSGPTWDTCSGNCPDPSAGFGSSLQSVRRRSGGNDDS
jgi:hypothetical protein